MEQAAAGRYSGRVKILRPGRAPALLQCLEIDFVIFGERFF